jgi:two-component system LytT family response regulator
VVAECRNGREAIEAVRGFRPDLLFLDIRMPGIDGFDVVRALAPEECPYIIFVTAHDRHAVRAFEVHALDYLVKPIDDQRFERALRRAADMIRRDQDGELGRRIRRAVGELRSDPAPTPAPVVDRYPIREKGKISLVRHVDIDWVGAEGDYVRLHAGARSWLVRSTLASVADRLGRRRFLKIHRSTLVNVDRIVEIQSLENGDGTVVLRDGTELRMSRGHRDAVERIAGRI